MKRSIVALFAIAAGSATGAYAIVGKSSTGQATGATQSLQNLPFGAAAAFTVEQKTELVDKLKAVGASAAGYFYDSVSSTHYAVFACDSMEDNVAFGLAASPGGWFSSVAQVLVSRAEVVSPKVAVTQFLSGLSSVELA